MIDQLISLTPVKKHPKTTEFDKSISAAFLSIIGLLTLVSCAISPTYYPEEAQTPLFTNKHQLIASLSVNGVERGYSGNLAYAITDQYFLAGKYSVSRFSNCRTCTTSIRDYGEFSMGKFNLSNDLNLTEMLVGLGKAKSESYDVLPFSEEDIPLAKSNYYRVFVQGNWSNRKTNFKKSFALRAVYLYLNNYIELDDIDQDITPSGSNSSLFLEPSGTLSYWMGNYFLKGQLGFSLPINYGNKFRHDWVWLVAKVGYRFDF